MKKITQMNTKNLLCVFLISFLIITLNAYSQVNYAITPNNNQNNKYEQYLKKHPLIPIEKILPNKSLPKFQNKLLKNLKNYGYKNSEIINKFPEHLSLYNYLGTKEDLRDQGDCGSCWIWSGLGCLEIMYNEKLSNNEFQGSNYVKNQKFSINHFEAKAQKYPFLLQDYSTSICDGGRPEVFASLNSYNDELKKIIPASNLNANYYLYTGNVDAVKDLNFIQQYPAVFFPNGVKESNVVEYEKLDDTETIKLNVMAALNNGYPVQIDFFVYGDFYDFWYEQTQDDLYMFPDNINYPEAYGAHAVIIVGYDVSSSNKDDHYWIVVNSWGTTYSRPNGIFKLKMNQAFNENSIFEYIAYNTNFNVEKETCDNIDNDCNGVIDDSNCEDLCEDNPNKTLPGVCGCEQDDIDSDFDGTLDCIDACPEDPFKYMPEKCGCGIEDSEENISDDDNNGIINCQEKDFFELKEVKLAPHSSTLKGLTNIHTNACALNKQGTLFCVGDNRAGQFVHNKFPHTTQLSPVPGVKNISKFAMGLEHICAIAKNDENENRAYCWGTDPFGASGDLPTPINEYFPFVTHGITDRKIDNPVNVVANYQTTCFTNDKGKTYCFGSNYAGKLGVKGSLYSQYKLETLFVDGYKCIPNEELDSGTRYFVNTPLEVPLDNISFMDQSAYETVSIIDGNLYNYGRHNMKLHLPEVRYQEFANAISASISEADLCVINKDKDLYCMDLTLNDIRQGPNPDKAPQKINLHDVDAVATGSEIMTNVIYVDDTDEKFGLCCSVNGSNYCYSMNGYNTDDDAHVCAISKGDLYCWGRTNYYGQIGSFREDTSVPQKVENVSNVTSVDATGGLTCYISEGNLYCFGNLNLLGINTVTTIPYKIDFYNSKTNNIVQEGAYCDYSDDYSGIYQNINGRVLCVKDRPIIRPTKTFTPTPTYTPIPTKYVPTPTYVPTPNIMSNDVVYPSTRLKKATVLSIIKNVLKIKMQSFKYASINNKNDFSNTTFKYQVFIKKTKRIGSSKEERYALKKAYTKNMKKNIYSFKKLDKGVYNVKYRVMITNKQMTKYTKWSGVRKVKNN